MVRVIALFGSMSGVIVGVSLLMGTLLSDGGGFPVWTGYLLMLLALSLIFVGMREYREKEAGGTLTFLQGCGVGLGITMVAGVFYVLAWEVSLALTDYAFIDSYAASLLEQAAALPEAQRVAREAEIAETAERYRDPLFRMPITLLEILPVGLLVTLVCAGMLRRPPRPA